MQVATLPDFLAFAASALKLAGVPLILDLHEDMPAFFEDRFHSPALRPLRPLIGGLTRASAAMADAILTVHGPLRELSLARGVSPDKVTVVMNSADDRLFDPARHARRPFMEDGELRLMHHSSLQRIYGLPVAIEAVAQLRDELESRLDVYGDGPYRPEIEEEIERLGVGERVALHGRAPLEELPGLLAGADLAIVPSLPEPYMPWAGAGWLGTVRSRASQHQPTPGESHPCRAPYRTSSITEPRWRSSPASGFCSAWPPVRPLPQVAATSCR